MEESDAGGAGDTEVFSSLTAVDGSLSIFYSRKNTHIKFVRSIPEASALSDLCMLL
jgi:hypothetical protein